MVRGRTAELCDQYVVDCAMNNTWRLLDTGVRSAAQNMALDQALLTTRECGDSPNTVRFLQFSPPVALVGVYQVVEQEIREEYCRDNGIDINRRITGGGSLLFDEVQLGWELIAGLDDFDVRPMSLAFHRMACDACIEGLRELGVDAAFRPRNDIEVEGRKISGTGGVEEGDAVLFQGTLLLDFDVASMIKALRIPTEKLKQSSLDSAADRVTWLKRELGELPSMERIKACLVRGFERGLGIQLEQGALLPAEEDEFRTLLPRFGSDEWVYGTRRRSSSIALVSGLHRTETATIRAHVQLDQKRRELRSALITGDFFITPQRAIHDLEARLKGLRLDWDGIERVVHDFWRETKPQTPGFGAGDICQALHAAVRRLEFLDFGFSLAEAEKLLPVNGSPREIFDRRIDVLLLPYCAKLPGCEYRKQNDCSLCGDCTFAEVWKAADEAGLEAVTIQSFEHLIETLDRLRHEGAEGYLGSCCEAFYNKHYADFHAAELPGILVDVNNATCYDLDKTRDAYLGNFEGQTDMDTELLRELIALVASRSEVRDQRSEVSKRRGLPQP